MTKKFSAQISAYYAPYRARTTAFSLPITHFAGIFGAIQLMGLLKSVIEWKELLLKIAILWAEFVRPVARFLFSWLIELLSLKVEPYILDYFTMALLLLLGELRFIIIAIVTAKFVDAGEGRIAEAMAGEDEMEIARQTQSKRKANTLTNFQISAMFFASVLLFVTTLILILAAARWPLVGVPTVITLATIIVVKWGATVFLTTILFLSLAIVLLCLWPIMASAALLSLLVSLPVKLGLLRIGERTLIQLLKVGQPEDPFLRSQIDEDYNYFLGLFNFGWTICSPFVYLLLILMINYLVLK